MPAGGKPGNKGGGRKSAYQEKADAADLEKMFLTKNDIEKLKKKIETGKYSVKDSFLYHALTGDQRRQNVIFGKLYPDKLESKEDITLKLDL